MLINSICHHKNLSRIYFCITERLKPVFEYKITLSIYVLVLWILKAYCVVKNLIRNVRIICRFLVHKYILQDVAHFQLLFPRVVKIYKSVAGWQRDSYRGVTSAGAKGAYGPIEFYIPTYGGRVKGLGERKFKISTPILNCRVVIKYIIFSEYMHTYYFFSGILLFGKFTCSYWNPFPGFTLPVPPCTNPMPSA